MRMWMLPPQLMCTQHLRGEHVETHMLVGSVEADRSIDGFLQRRLIEPQSVNSRHNAVVAELKLRGRFNHQSQLPKLVNPERGSVCVEQSVRDITSRCADCRHRLRFLLVGQAPSSKPKFETYSFKRLCTLAGMSPEAFTSHFDHVNVLKERPKSNKKGDNFPVKRGSMTLEVPHHRVILLGKRVRDAFGLKLEYFEPAWLDDTTQVVTMPHPSGVNRWWNDAENRRVAADFVANCIEFQLSGKAHYWSFRRDTDRIRSPYEDQR